MAKFIWVEAVGIFTYALDECEDYLLLDAYLHLRDSGKFAGLKTLRIFEFYHLQEGGTLNDNILMQINGCLRQIGHNPLVFVNGHTTAYAHLRGQDKVIRRAEILARLRALPAADRATLLAVKRGGGRAPAGTGVRFAGDGTSPRFGGQADLRRGGAPPAGAGGDDAAGGGQGGLGRGRLCPRIDHPGQCCRADYRNGRIARPGRPAPGHAAGDLSCSPPHAPWW